MIDFLRIFLNLLKYPFSKGPFKNDVTEAEGRGYPKLVIKSDIMEIEVHANSDITTKKIMY